MMMLYNQLELHIYHKNIQVISLNKSSFIQLREKLSQSFIDEDRTQKQEIYEHILNLIYQKVQILYQKEQTKMKLNNIEKIYEMKKLLKQNKIYKQINTKNFHYNTQKKHERNLQQSTKKDLIHYKVFEMRLTNLMDEQFYKMRIELTKQQQSIKETKEQYKQEMDLLEQVFSVQETLNQGKVQRSESQNQIDVSIQEINDILNFELTEEKVSKEMRLTEQ
ncbi:unnamed protein product [Paramecium primaurelia]|uniref:Uncharacterized protein n=1 Tax=Paramecium primaurelia TaxID=5886 RepID=A0A8S1L4Y4_PARPR|nr:unnamed protein product [Paramecium primaurelia]